MAGAPEIGSGGCRAGEEKACLGAVVGGYAGCDGGVCGWVGGGAREGGGGGVNGDGVGGEVWVAGVCGRDHLREGEVRAEGGGEGGADEAAVP